jgi:hypothetical protein
LRFAPKVRALATALVSRLQGRLLAGCRPIALAFYQAAQKSGKGEQWMSIPR